VKDPREYRFVVRAVSAQGIRSKWSSTKVVTIGNSFWRQLRITDQQELT
jgi:hypothetical protein